VVIIPPYPRTLLLLFLLVVVGEGWSQALFPAWRGLVQDDTAQHIAHAISALLAGSPFAYTRAVVPSYFSNGKNIGPAADSRSAFEFYAEDSWKATPRIILNYGLRYELYTPISERAKRSSGVYTPPGGGQEFLINPQPRYRSTMNNWGPRFELNYLFSDRFRGHAGAGLTTILPNIWQDNDLTGGLPFVISPRVTAAPGAQVPYGFQISPAQLPRVYTPAGTEIFADGETNDVQPNTLLDVGRLELDIASLCGQPSPLNVQGISRGFGNAGLGTWTLGLERSLGNVTASVTYVGTTAWKLARISSPNAYPGATARFAQFTEFTAAGVPVGGLGTESVVTPTSHSNYHALQLSAAGPTGHGGPGIQASYTYSKSIDDTSSVGGTSATSTVGAMAQAAPQNPFDTHGTSTSSLSDFRLPTGVSFMSEMSNSQYAGPRKVLRPRVSKRP
jgi:hypothetical protein